MATHQPTPARVYATAMLPEALRSVVCTIPLRYAAIKVEKEAANDRAP